MNQLLLDGRSLEGIVSSIIRRNDLHLTHSRMDWERMYRMADYHKVANIVHLGILGYGDAIPAKWKERFFTRYQEALLYGAGYQEAVNEMLTWMDTRNISCTVLCSESMRSLYAVSEMADCTPLMICLDEKNYSLVRGYLIDLGYETEQAYEGEGERLARPQGICITLYYRLPFQTAKYAKGMQRLLESASLKEPYRYVRMLPAENELVYRMAAAAYHYVTDELTMREVLDLQLFHRNCRDTVRMDTVAKRLAEFQIDELAEKILRLSYMWFGDRADTYYENLPEDMTPYDVLEERLLTKGMVNHETDVQALKLQKMIQKELDKVKREERIHQFREKVKEKWEKALRKIRWCFPDYHYMASIYPMVEKIPPLLPVFWIIRGVRLLTRAIKG